MGDIVDRRSGRSEDGIENAVIIMYPDPGLLGWHEMTVVAIGVSSKVGMRQRDVVDIKHYLSPTGDVDTSSATRVLVETGKWVKHGAHSSLVSKPVLGFCHGVQKIEGALWIEKVGNIVMWLWIHRPLLCITIMLQKVMVRRGGVDVLGLLS